MANILNEIKKKVKPGQHVYYIDKNNTFDNTTLTDTKNEVEAFIKNQNKWHEILEAVYSSVGKHYIAAPAKSSGSKIKKFSVINSKNTTEQSFEVEMYMDNNALVMKNLLDAKKETMIETAAVMDSTKDTPTDEQQVDRLLDNLKNNRNKFKNPSELKDYLEKIINTKA